MNQKINIEEFLSVWKLLKKWDFSLKRRLSPKNQKNYSGQKNSRSGFFKNSTKKSRLLARQRPQDNSCAYLSGSELWKKKFFYFFSFPFYVFPFFKISKTFCLKINSMYFDFYDPFLSWFNRIIYENERIKS